jgi:hypothetical protein
MPGGATLWLFVIDPIDGKVSEEEIAQIGKDSKKTKQFMLYYDV